MGLVIKIRRPAVYDAIGLGAHAAGVQAAAAGYGSAAMTAQRRPAASRADTTIVRAGPADINVLSQVIADAFFPLAPCQWLIPDQAARREILPGFFRMYVEHAMADGLVDTTVGRTAAALWIPVGPGGPGQPGGHDERLAEVTGQWAERFMSFDQELDAHHLTGLASPGYSTASSARCETCMIAM